MYSLKIFIYFYYKYYNYYNYKYYKYKFIINIIIKYYNCNMLILKLNN